jgi:pimeloyl-ACP methyl ester carboxylesterase
MCIVEAALKNPVSSFLIAIAVVFGAGQLSAEPVKIPHNELNLVGEFVVAEDRKPSDSTILILHGTLAHLGMETIKGLQAVLTERGHNTLSINLSFSLDNRTGMYDCAVPHKHIYDDAVTELSVWFDWLAKKGVKDVTLFGHSRGGGQAALFGSGKGHDLVKRFVLMAPATWNAEKVAKGFEKSHGRPLEAALVDARARVADGTGAELMKGAGILYCPGADVTADSFLSYYEPDTRFDTPTLLPQIKQPVLVVAAGQDQVVPDIAERVKPMIDGDHRRLVVVDDADHFFLDLFSEDVADAMEEFIDPGS